MTFSPYFVTGLAGAGCIGALADSFKATVAGLAVLCAGEAVDAYRDYRARRAS